jgi:SNF2 family DNA or RNA helicase
MVQLRRCFAGAQRAGKTVVLKDTLKTCRDLAWFTDRYPLEVQPDPSYLASRSAVHRHRETEVQELFSGAIVPRAVDLAVTPRSYQSIAAEVVLRRGSLLLADDLGLGKTISAICALVDPRSRPALVVAPTHLTAQWNREIQRCLPGVQTHILKKASPYLLTLAGGDQGALFDDCPEIVITSYSKLAGWADVFSGKVSTVVFDEAQELRSGLARKTPAKYIAAQQIAAEARFRVMLTATPIYNFGGEFFALLDILDPEFLGTFDEFHREWCSGQADKARLNDPEAFGRYLTDSGVMLRRTKKDVGQELPPMQLHVQHIEADMGALNAVAQDAEELARVILSSTGSGFDKMRASEELDAMIRCATGVAKAPHVAAFVRMLVENGEKVVLFGWHHSVYTLWERDLGDLGVLLYTGKQSAKEKEAALTRFKTSDAKVLVLSLRAGAGIDGLQDVCSTCVFGELDWSPGVHQQCIGRLDRERQKNPVFAYMLVADVGSDPIVADIVGLKKAQLDRTINPDAPILETAQADPDRIKKLAEAYLSRKKAA